MMQLLVDGLYNLPQASYPTSQLFGPGLAAVSFERANHLGLIMMRPVLVRFKSLVHHVIAHCWVPCCRHAGLGIVAECEEVLGHGLVFGAGWGKTEPSNDSLGIVRDQQISVETTQIFYLSPQWSPDRGCGFAISANTVKLYLERLKKGEIITN